MKVIKTIQMACGQAYVVAIDKEGKELLEVGDVFLPNENVKGTRPYHFKDFGNVSDLNKRVITVCTMVGCCFGCTFCSMRRSFKRNLTRKELLAQVDFCLNEGKKYGRNEDLNKSKELHVLFTRMGEPLVNFDELMGAISDLVARYPHVQIGLSTCGLRDNVRRLLDYPELAKHIMLQFSAHGTDESTRSKIFDTRTGDALMTLEEIGRFTKEFRKLNPRMVSLNFVLLKGVNYDFQSLKKIADPEDFYIRLSPLNVTGNSDDRKMQGLILEEDVVNKAPCSSVDLKSIISDLKEAGFAYAYAPAIDEEIKNKAACGQALETLKVEDAVKVAA